MSVALGVDVGGSTTKIAALDPSGGVAATVQVRAGDQLTSLYGAVGRLLYENDLKLGDVGRIFLTGVGASAVDGDIYGIPTERVEEFLAIGRGGLLLTGLSRALVVSMGTGTAFVRADPSGCRHIGGSGVGGGTLLGLSEMLLDTDDIDAVLALASEGDLSKVDLTVREISRGEIPTLPPETTAANFGSIKSTARKQDVALGLINMVFETAGVMASFAHGDGCPAVVTGTMATLPQARKLLDGVSRLFGVEFIIPERAAFATAIGAASISSAGR